MSSGRTIASLFFALVLGWGAAASGQVSPITGQNAPAAVCFTDGTDPAYVARRTSLVNLQNQAFFGVDYYPGGSRWSGAQGTPRALTWSLVPDGLSISGGVGEATAPSVLFSTFDSGYASQGGRATWVNRLQQCFDRWSQVTGVTFTRVTVGGNDWDDGAAWGTGSAAGARGDIRISAHNIDGASGILAYTFYPSSGDMVIDSSDIGNFAISSNLDRFLRDCVTHELGHALGLNHVCSANSNQLMEPFINTAFDGPQQDDIRGVQHWYGDPFESNNSAATATSIGTLNLPGTVSIGTIPNPLTGANDPNAALCSIDAPTAVDWWVLNASVSMTANFTVTPVGSTYDDSPQAGDGSCPSTHTTNALAIADLQMDVYSNGGATLLASANGPTAGVAASLPGLAIPAGNIYIKVSATNAPGQTQLYRLSVSSSCATATFTQNPTDQTVPDRTPITLTAAVTGATSVHWRKDNVDLVDDGRITGSSTTTLNISPTILADTGSYVLAAVNACGTAPSAPAAVTITCYANCDGSTVSPVLNVADFLCFLQAFQTNDPYANCDGSTTPPVLNVIDFTCYFQKFNQGCP